MGSAPWHPLAFLRLRWGKTQLWHHGFTVLPISSCFGIAKGCWFGIAQVISCYIRLLLSPQLQFIKRSPTGHCLILTSCPVRRGEDMEIPSSGQRDLCIFNRTEESVHRTEIGASGKNRNVKKVRNFRPSSQLPRSEWCLFQVWFVLVCCRSSQSPMMRSSFPLGLIPRWPWDCRGSFVFWWTPRPAQHDDEAPALSWGGWWASGAFWALALEAYLRKPRRRGGGGGDYSSENYSVYCFLGSVELPQMRCYSE